jgi:2,4-dienoyl-CoA reductase-like NADH-dependent reductase (Old Yellow Enzyme family)
VGPREGGFNGIDIRGADGYPRDQFINGARDTQEDTQEDRHGGTIGNRRRFTLATADALVDATGGERNR